MMLDVIFISVKLATTLALPDHSNSRPFDTNAPRQEARGTSAGSDLHCSDWLACLFTPRNARRH